MPTFNGFGSVPHLLTHSPTPASPLFPLARSPKKKRKKQSRRKRTSGEAGFGSGEDDNDGGGAGGGIGDSSAAVASIGSLPTSAGAESPDLGGGPDEGDDTDAAAAAASALNVGQWLCARIAGGGGTDS